MIAYWKSFVDQEQTPVVICDTNHKILYMNPVACKHYEDQGGESLVGKSLLACHPAEAAKVIDKILAWFGEDISHNRVHTFYSAKSNKDGYMVALRDEQGELIGYYEKQIYRTPDEEALYQMD